MTSTAQGPGPVPVDEAPRRLGLDIEELYSLNRALLRAIEAAPPA